MARGTRAALVVTPVRQFQVLAMAVLALSSWMAISIRAFRSAGPDRCVPAPLMFWGATVLGILTLNAAGLAPTTSPALYWDDYYGIAQWAAVLWWLLALATVVAAIVRALQPRRDRVRRRPPGGQLPFEQAAVLQRSGDGDLLTDEERERMGAGGSGWTVLTLFFGIIGLGPVGLFTGIAAMEGHRTSSWLATIGILLSAVQTTILLAAAALAMSTA